MRKKRPCKDCGKENQLGWGRYCGACRRRLGLVKAPPKPSRPRGKYSIDTPWTDALWHRYPGSFESGKRR